MPRKLTEEEFKEKARKVHGDKYDYDYVDYVNSSTKVTIVCPEHGPFPQKPSNHLAGQGCFECKGKRRFTTEEFKRKARQVHGDRYNYDYVEYITSQTKVKIICSQHGAFLQTPNDHLSGKGCSSCGGVKKSTTEKFIQRSLKKHGNKYDYRHVDYKNNQTSVKIICPQHGPFWQTPANHLKGKGCIVCGGKLKLSKEEFEERARGIHDNKYNYDCVDYQTAHTLVTILCPEHGPFEQTPMNHLTSRIGCPVCSNESSKGIYGYQWLRENPHKHNDPCLIYLIEMYDDQESFLKLGLTKNSVRERYGSKQARSGYDYEVLFQEETTMKQGIILEDMIGDELIDQKYRPFKSFSGRTECFSSETKDLILNHLIHYLFDEQEL